jgi:hypothetical protein
MPASDHEDATGTSTSVDSPATGTDNGAAARDKPTVCANCSHSFAGTYCPNCGQKRGAAVTVLDLVSGFFREVMDLEGGFWPTVKGLTLHPGRTLQRYLSGARRSYMHPGRYLLASIVIATLVMQAMTWAGITAETSITEEASGAAAPDTTTAETTVTDTTSAAYQIGYQLGRLLRPEVEPDGPGGQNPDSARAEPPPESEITSGASSGDAREANPDDSEPSAQSYLNEFFSLLGDHYFRMTMSVTVAFFLGLVYRRLFRASLPTIPLAIALGLFITAHFTILETLIAAPIQVGTYLPTGEPLDTPTNLLGTIGFLLWCGIAAGSAFGTSWRSRETWWAGLKGLGGAVAAYLDAIATLLLLIGGYAAVRSLWSGSGGMENPVLMAILALIGAVGILLLFTPHLALIAVQRLRRR